MQKRAVFHIIVVKDKGWAVKKKGVKKPVKSFTSKVNAVKAGKRLAKHTRLGQLIVHKKNGKIQTEYTYKKDPKRYKG